MSKFNPNCYHCLILRKAMAYYNRGRNGNEIAVEILSALADYVANTVSLEGEGRPDFVADSLFAGFRQMIKERALAMQQPAGRA